MPKGILILSYLKGEKVSFAQRICPKYQVDFLSFSPDRMRPPLPLPLMFTTPRNPILPVSSGPNF